MPDQTPVEPAMPTTATPDDPPPKKYESMEQIFEEILERSGLESFKDVPRTARAFWIDPDGKGMSLKIGEENPFGGKDTVFGIFHDDAEIRVFTLPKEQGELKRYALSKHGRVYVIETFPDLDMWIEEMAAEFRDLLVRAVVREKDADEALDDDEETPPTNGATTTS